MTTSNLTNEPLHLVLRNARRAARLTQAMLSSQAGCTQSALSMMEQGKATAVSQETLEKIATILKVELPKEEPVGITPVVFSAPAVARCCCPNFQCPSNMPYIVGQEILFMPLGLSGTGAFCKLCGEPLISACPGCGAPLGEKPGAFCSDCGMRLIEVPMPFPEPDPAAWVRARQALTETIRSVN